MDAGIPTKTSGNRVGAYSVAPATGALTFINDVAASGTGPTHVSIDATGAHVFVANYGNGTVAVFPVQAGGGVGAAAQTLTPGANAHMIAADATDLRATALTRRRRCAES